MSDLPQGEQRGIFRRLRALVMRLPFIERLGLHMILGILVSLLCLWAFSLIADDLIEPTRLTPFDLPISEALYASATPLSIALYRFLSFLGMEMAASISIVVGIYFIRRRQWYTLIWWIAAVIGGLVLNNALKIVFARPRPVFSDPIVIAYGFSFPSGHSMQSLIVYGLLCALLWNRVKNRYARIFVTFGLVLLIILVGISRIMLGAHYFTDVIGGYAAGGVWLMICLIALDAINRRAPPTLS